MNAIAEATRIGSWNQRRESTLPNPLESSMRNTTTGRAYVGFPRNNTKRWMNAISARMYPKPMAMKYSRRRLRPDRASDESSSGTTRKTMTAATDMTNTSPKKNRSEEHTSELQS